MSTQSTLSSTEVFQVATNAMVTIMTLNIFAGALGTIIASTPGAMGVTPRKLKAGDPAVAELKKAYGDLVVNRAIADVTDSDAIKLAERVQFYIYQDLKQTYGTWAAERAIEGAPPGDMRMAIEIARSLQQSGVTQESPVVEKVKAIARGKLRGRSKAIPVRDTKTGIIYRSESAAGKALAQEFGTPITNTYAYYKIIKDAPGRLVHV